MNWKIIIPILLLLVAILGSAIAKDQGKITLYGRRSSSGTYLFFRDEIVGQEYSSNMFSMSGNQSIVEAVRSDTNGIGYVGVGYVLKDNGSPVNGIKILEISRGENSEPVTPLKPANVKTGKYPIARPLYQYVASIPGKDSLVYNFLNFELSEEGSQTTIDTGFYPVTPDDREHNETQFEKAKMEGSSEETPNGSTLTIKGSDTMLQLVSSLTQSYLDKNPGADIVVEGGGSGTGIAALIGGRVDIADSSRSMEKEEIEKCKNNGINPLEFIIARDCICIIVNDSNPVENLTMNEVSKIFSGEIESWEELS